MRFQRRRLVEIGLAALLALVIGGAALYWFVVRSGTKPRAHIEQTELTPGRALDGTYTLRPLDGRSFVGYRVQEQFAAATVESTTTGRTGEVEGTLSISGTVVDAITVNANLTTLKSDNGLRDQRIRERGLESDRFPQARFALTRPITVVAVPKLGETVHAAANGDFTLHGVTRSVTIPVSGRWDGATVQVVGSLPITFADYGIVAPSIGGFTSVRDRGEMEFQLFFVHA